MAKIPRINQGDRPSAVPRGTLPDAASGPAGAIDAFGNVLDVGYKIASDQEHEQALVLREAQEKIQAIGNTVDAAKREGNFTEASLKEAAQLQEKHAAKPADAIPEYIDNMRKAAADGVAQAPNAEIGLKIANGFAERIATGTREMHVWALAKTKQNIEINVEESLNESSAVGGQFQGGVEEFGKFVEGERTRLGPGVLAALGDEKGSARLVKLASETAYAYLANRAMLQPYQVMDELKATTGPVARYLDGPQRTSLQHIAEAREKGLPLARQRDTLVKGIRQNADDASFILTDDIPQGEKARTVFTRLHGVETERETLLLDKSVGEAEKKGRLATFDARIKFLKAGQDLMMHQAGWEIQDKPGVAAEINIRQREIIKTIGSKVRLKGDNGLPEIMAQYSAIFEGMMGGAISPGSGKAMIRQLEQAIPAGRVKEQENTWSAFNWQLPYADASEAGSFALEQEFKLRFPRATQAQKNNATDRLTQAMVDANDAGAAITTENAPRLAREMAARAMGRDPAGHFTGKAKKP